MISARINTCITSTHDQRMAILVGGTSVGSLRQVARETFAQMSSLLMKIASEKSGVALALLLVAPLRLGSWRRSDVWNGRLLKHSDLKPSTPQAI
jgi:hypothetical protein